MAENIKLKDLYDEEQSYTDIGTIAVPKTDGSGNTYYVQRPIINYTLQDPPTYELTDGVFALNMGDGTFLGELDRGNFAGAVSGPVEGKNTKPIASMRIDKTPVTGVTETPWTTTMLLYLYESLTSAVLLEILNIESTAVFTAQPGWGQMLYDKDGTVTGYAQITDPAAVTFGIQQPNDLLNASNFYALLSEVTQEEQNVSVTENGAQTIVPTAGKSGIRKVALNVNVPSGGGNLQEKAVTFTTNGTQEIIPDEGYDGMRKVLVTTNVPSSGGDVDAYKAAIYQYGDPDGDGCAIRTVWPASGIRLDLWAKASGKWDWASSDYNYWHLWESIIKYSLNSDTLNSFAPDLMTNLTSEFASVFEGGTKASFMALEHVCTIPAIADSDPKTLAGLLAVLARSLDELQQGWLYDDFMYPPDYSFVFPEAAINAVYSPAGGDTVSIPFIMRPVVADGGTRMTGYNVQTPSGAMATYETGFKSFANAEGGNPLAVGYCNTIPAYGITSELVAVILANDSSRFNVAWYSYGGQTLVNAVLQQFLAGLWTSDMGDVTLTEGWNMTAVQAGTPQTANNLTEAIVQEQLTTAFPSGIPAQFVSTYLAEMDDYEKSVFLPVTTPTYKYVGKKSLQLNITLAIPEDTTE